MFSLMLMMPTTPGKQTKSLIYFLKPRSMRGFLFTGIRHFEIGFLPNEKSHLTLVRDFSGTVSPDLFGELLETTVSIRFYYLHVLNMKMLSTH